MLIAAGKLDRKILFQVATETRDDAGDVLQTWVDSKRYFARKQDNTSRQFFGANQIIHEADTMFSVRDDSYTKTIAPEKHRVICDGRVYEIIGNVEGAVREDIRMILCAARPDQRGPQAPE